MLTAESIPGRNGVGIILKDEPVLVTDKIRRSGDALALVAAEDRQIAAAALEKIEVQLQETPAVFSPQEAMSSEAPLVHQGSNILARRKIRKGNIQEALDRAAVIVKKTYRTTFVEHAYLEPESSLALREGEYRLDCNAEPHFDRGNCCRVGYRPEQSQGNPAAYRRGFGGKLDISTQCHAALLAWHTAVGKAYLFP